MMQRYRIRYFGECQKMCEVVISAPTADDALTFYEVNYGGSRHRNRSSAGPMVGDVQSIGAVEESKA